MSNLKQKRRKLSVGCHSNLAVDLRGSCASLLHDLTDAELLIEYAENRKIEAMQIFVQRHEKKIMAVCRNVTSDANDADDSFQATFLAALKHAKRLRNVNSHGGWLCRVAYNASLKIQKIKRREVTVSRESMQDEIPDPVPDTWRVLEKREEADALLQELFRLPKQYQDCLVLFYFDGLSRTETANRMGKSVPAVKALLERGRRMMKSRLIKRGVSAAVAISVVQWSARNSSACDPAVIRLTREYCESFVQSAKQNYPDVIHRLSDVGSRVWMTNQITLTSFALATCLLITGLIGVSNFEIHGDENSEQVLQVEPDESPSNSVSMKIENATSLNAKSKQELVQIELDLRQKIAKSTTRLAQLRKWESQKIEHIQSANSLQETTSLLRILAELQIEAANVDSVLKQDKEQLIQVKTYLQNE